MKATENATEVAREDYEDLPILQNLKNKSPHITTSSSTNVTFGGA